jgi:solute carrier family 50 protein (sugar transporter)
MPNGTKKINVVKNNNFDDYGLMYNINGEFYEGYYLSNVRHGYGILNSQVEYKVKTGLFYKGELKFGSLRHKDFISEGEFNIGLKDGYIIEYDRLKRKQLFEGVYKDGKRDGFGINYYDNGNISYKGYFKNNLEDIFGWAALCLNMCIYLTPVLPFINVLKGKVSYEDTPGVLVSATYVNCFCWYIYGDMIFSDQVKICNCIGAIISLCLIVIYLVYEIRKFTLDAILNALIIITGSYATYRGLTIVVDDDAVIGKICNVTAIIVFLNPMYLIYKVIREKNNYILIPIYTAWVSLFAYGLWVIYGIIIKDVYLMVPNVIGIVLSIIQICIYIIFKKKYPTFGEREKDTSTIDIENTGNDDRREDTTIKDDEEIQNNSKGKPVKIVSKLDN